MVRHTYFLWTLMLASLLFSGCVQVQNENAPRNAPTLVALEPTNTPLPPATPLVDSDPCSTTSQHRQIDEAYERYRADRTADGAATERLADWALGVSAEIAANCNQGEFQTSDPAELATLLDKLQAGGYIIYVRHTHTDRSRGDDDVSFGACDQQRVLSERGRNESLMIRNAYQQLDLPVSLLISTQYCRTLETAVLAFGVPKLVLRTDLRDSLAAQLGVAPEAGTNTIIVAHIGTLRSAVGLDDTFEEGDSFVYRPTGDGGFEFIGRIALYDWPILADIHTNH